MPCDVWAVQLCGFEIAETAGVFATYADAAAYASWWNLHELRRFGRDSGKAAVVEPVDFYPAGAWRPRPYAVNGGRS